MAEMANALHHATDAEKYQQEFDSIAAAYRKEFVKDDGTVTGNNSDRVFLRHNFSPASRSHRFAQILSIVS